MLIKYPDRQFDASLDKAHHPIYLLVGTDDFLLNACADAIKKSWRSAHTDTESKRLYLEHLNDWYALFQEADTYDLFHDYALIDATFQKKNIEAKAKTSLKAYLENPNAKNLIIIRAPQLTAKQYTSFKNLQVIAITPLNARTELDWIASKLKHFELNYTDKQIPLIIQSYTQGNLHAAHQTIERISLFHSPGDTIDRDSVLAQCIDARDSKLYAISDACLLGEQEKVSDLIKRAELEQIEPVLILWILAQELRRLEQIQSGSSYQSLNIYSFRMQPYQLATKRLSRSKIYQLLTRCQALDTMIKSDGTKQIWVETERLALDFST